MSKALVAVAAILLSACGSGDVGSTPAPTTPPSATADYHKWIGAVCKPDQIFGPPGILKHAYEESFCHARVGGESIIFGIYTDEETLLQDVQYAEGGYSVIEDKNTSAGRSRGALSYGMPWVFVVFNGFGSPSAREVLQPLQQFGFTYTPGRRR
jgi:hypothetical protein